MSKSVTYVGPYAAGVTVQFGEFGSGDEVFVVPGETVDLPDATADELVDRGEFVHAAAGGDGRPPQSATKEEWVAYRVIAQGHDVEGLTKDQLIDLPDQPPAKEG